MAELVFVQAVVIYSSLGIALDLVWLRNLFARRPRWRWDSTEAEVLEFADQLRVENANVVHVGPVPIVPGPPPPIVVDGQEFRRRPAPLHRYQARHRMPPAYPRIGERRPTRPLLVRNPSACLFRPPAGWPHRTRLGAAA